MIHPTSKIFETAKITEQTNLYLKEKTTIGDFVFINLNELIMKRGSQINAGTICVGGGKLIVGEYSVIGYNCTILTGTDQPNAPFMADAAPKNLRNIIKGEIIIGDNCFIGSNTILSINRKNRKLTIGDGTVIGSGCYIDKPIEPNKIITPKQTLIIKNRKIKL